MNIFVPFSPTVVVDRQTVRVPPVMKLDLGSSVWRLQQNKTEKNEIELK